MLQAKLTHIGDALGVALPPEALAKLHMKEGDMLYLYESPEGYTLTSSNDVFAGQMAIAKKIMQDDQEFLRKLANS